MSLKKYLSSSPSNHGLNDFNDRVGIAGFRFDARTSEQESFSNDIPTTPLEDGSFANDHIIRKPRTLTIEGEIGSVFSGGLSTVDKINRVSASLGTNSFYARHVSLLQTAVNFTTKLIDSNPAKLFNKKSINSANAQQQFVAHMERLYQGKMLFTVDSERFGVIDNVAIKSLSKKRSNIDDSIFYSLTVQQIEFAKTTKKPLKRSASGSSTDSQVNSGSQVGEKVKKPKSILAAIF